VFFSSIDGFYLSDITVHRFIKRYILDPDFKTYGAVDLTSLAAPSVRVAGPSTALKAPAVANTSDDDHDDD
jgi:hypothetical protein